MTTIFNVASAATCRAMLIDMPLLRYEVIKYRDP
jgi:hypothetical protein